MAKRKSKKRKRTKNQKGPGLLARTRARFQRAQERFRAALPPWLDEIGAVLLISLGLVSVLILLGFDRDAWLAISWGDTLRQVFGPPGALVIAVSMVAGGLFVLLPKLGRPVRVPWHRLLAGIFAFAGFLALLHLLHPGPFEGRALAEAGMGGGYIGWVLSEAAIAAAGKLVALFFWLLVFVLAAALVVGVRRRWARAGLDRIRQRALRAAQEIDAAPPASEGEPPQAAAAPNPSKRKKKKRRPHVRRFSSPGLPGERESIVPRDDTAPQPYLEPPEEGFVVRDHTDKRKVRKREPRLPPMDLLQDHEINRPDDKELSTNARTIEGTLEDFGIETRVVGVSIGPTVTQYAVQPFREVEDEEGNLQLHRVRVRKIASLAGDLALALEAARLRIQAPVPGTRHVGIEVPNREPGIVALRPLLESEAFYRVNKPLAVPLGRDVSGAPVVVNLAAMPHLLIAGTTGSGKSVAIAAMASALLMNNTPEDLQFIMIDPKMVELVRFNGVPHLAGPVETDVDRAIGVLNWATREMDRRYKLLEDAGARNIDIYNRRAGKDDRLPYMAVFIDEIGDMMLSMPDETEAALCRLAQMARAIGMHLVVATQRPSTDIITGLIKANFPARISFAVASGTDSRVILDAVGAENLLGSGDMLFLAPDAAGPERVQGSFVTDEEIEDVVGYWEAQHQAAVEVGDIPPPDRLAPWERGLTRRELLADTDELLEDAIDLVVNRGRASTSLIQRRLGIGYPRAARLMGFLEELGVVGPAERGGRRRRVLIDPGEDTFRQLIDERARARRRK